MEKETLNLLLGSKVSHINKRVFIHGGSETLVSVEIYLSHYMILLGCSSTGGLNIVVSDPLDQVVLLSEGELSSYRWFDNGDGGIVKFGKEISLDGETIGLMLYIDGRELSLYNLGDQLFIEWARPKFIGSNAVIYRDIA